MPLQYMYSSFAEPQEGIRDPANQVSATAYIAVVGFGSTPGPIYSLNSLFTYNHMSPDDQTVFVCSEIAIVNILY